MSNYGSFNIKGIEQLEKAIMEKYEGTKARSIQKQTIADASEIVVEKLRGNYEKVNGKYSKGYTAAEVMSGNPTIKNEVTSAKVGWNGSKNRWRLIHLEEWGYVRSGKQYKPPSYRTIEKTLKEVEQPYLEEIRKGLSEFL